VVAVFVVVTVVGMFGVIVQVDWTRLLCFAFTAAAVDVIVVVVDNNDNARVSIIV